MVNVCDSLSNRACQRILLVSGDLSEGMYNLAPPGAARSQWRIHLGKSANFVEFLPVKISKLKKNLSSYT